MSTTTRGTLAGSCQPPSTLADAAREDPLGDARPAVAQHAARADQQVDLAQVLAGALDDAALGADHDLAAAGVPAQREADRRAGDAPRRRRLGVVVGDEAGSSLTAYARPRPGRRGRASATVVTADQRMPRSPSTVRVTRVVATTSRLERRVLRVELDDAVHVGGRAADVDDHDVAGAGARQAAASSSTPVSTTSGVAPCTMRDEVGPAAEVLAADHVGQEHLADRGPGADSGARTPIRGTTLSAQHVRRRRRGSSATSSRASTLPATTTGPGQPARRARGRGQDDLAVAAVGAAGEQHDVRARWRGGRRGRRHDSRPRHRHHLAAAGERDPAAGLGGDQLLVADHRDPQAAARARAGQHLGASPRGRPGAASAARQASYPSRTSVPMVVAVGGRRDDAAVVEVDQRRPW